MKTAILVHGMPSKEEYFSRPGYRASEQQWLPWLKGQLEAKGIKTATPEMPEPYEPDYEKWSAVFGQTPVDQDTILVGHSCGGGFLVRWLSENKIEVGKVVLVAPWINPDGKYPIKMFDGLTIDENLAERTAGVTEFISTDDDQEELDTLKILQSKIKDLQVREFNDKGHFILEHMKTNEFLELRDFLLK